MGMTIQERLENKDWIITFNKNGTVTARKKMLSVTRKTIEELSEALRGL